MIASLNDSPGPEPVRHRLLEVNEGLPAPSVHLQHGPFRQGLGDGDESDLGPGDADHRPDLGAAPR
jgi:hypothetical protein